MGPFTMTGGKKDSERENRKDANPRLLLKHIQKHSLWLTSLQPCALQPQSWARTNKDGKIGLAGVILSILPIGREEHAK
jgi:hypothetical protein